ncbi:MAG: hypothetical protein BHW34_03385 [Firmicutes bacterium CAG:176_59_8]|nr:MAG: hypothetical protein BHW34_03385 [Firmicutes bacterium CAG:176_59_8]
MFQGFTVGTPQPWFFFSASGPDVKEVPDGEVFLIDSQEVQRHAAGGAQDAPQQPEEGPHLVPAAA